MPQNAQNIYDRALSAQAIEAAFVDGRLYIDVDPEPRKLTRGTAPFAGSNELPVDGSHTVRFVHVMSRPAHGEIRGYALMDQSPVLHLRLPARPHDWPELDAAVAARLDIATANVKVKP